ncbi:MAG: hypothetical protein AAGB05_08800 [Pseudomonadota bacterium]
MSDSQIRQFNKRLKKIDKIHRRGGGFEAEGTLGQSYYTRRARRAARPVLRPMFALVAAVLVVKSIAAGAVTPEDYSARVDALRDGTNWQQASALVMAPDPISQTVGGWIAPLLSPQS